MARKRTGRPNGRPRIPLREHPNKLHLALCDCLQKFGGMSAAKARLYVVALMTGVDPQPTPFEQMTAKMRERFEKGWTVMSVEIPGSGNKASSKPKERFQSINALEQMAERYSSPEDLGYRTGLAALVGLSLFAKGNDAARRGMVEMLLMHLDDPDPRVRAIADQILLSP